MNASRRLCIFHAAVLALSSLASAEPTQHVRNPLFQGQGATCPQPWSALEVAVAGAACRHQPKADGLAMDAPGKPFAVGGAWQTLDGIASGKAYAVEVDCKYEKLADPFRSLLVRIIWTHDGRPKQPAGMLVRGAAGKEGVWEFRDVLLAPKDCDGARLSLELKWPGGGSVVWQRASVVETSAPGPRKVKIGTVYLRPRNSTVERNRELFAQKVEEAGRLGLDIVCLPEAIAVVGTPRRGVDEAESIPGPTTERLGKAAREGRVWTVAGIYERDGETIYNTAVLLDREGKVAGKYRKVDLNDRECLEWVGHWRSIGPRDRMPETYGPLMDAGGPQK